MVVYIETPPFKLLRGSDGFNEITIYQDAATV